MSRIATTFQQLKSRGEPALIAYLMAGDPSLQQSTEYFEALARGGADIIEIGIPFSDPVADGPTIQAAGLRALKANIKLEDIFQMAQNLRSKTQAPLVFMTYFNPIFAYGEDKFLSRCQEIGIDGLILPDVPLEEAETFSIAAQEKNIDIIFLATPATREDRLKRMAELTRGFLYLVGRYGVTGSQATLADQTRSLIQNVRRVVGNVPLAVGFGLSTAEQIRGVIDAGADGGVVGSALVQEVERGILPQLLTEKVRLLKVGARPHTPPQSHQPSQQHEPPPPPSEPSQY
jgi:tryptophan synthase alpha chain